MNVLWIRLFFRLLKKRGKKMRAHPLLNYVKRALTVLQLFDTLQVDRRISHENSSQLSPLPKNLPSPIVSTPVCFYRANFFKTPRKRGKLPWLILRVYPFVLPKDVFLSFSPTPSPPPTLLTLCHPIECSQRAFPWKKRLRKHTKNEWKKKKPRKYDPSFLTETLLKRSALSESSGGGGGGWGC